MIIGASVLQRGQLVNVDVVELTTDVENHDPHHEDRDEDVQQNSHLDQERNFRSQDQRRKGRRRFPAPGSRRPDSGPCGG